MNSRGVSLRIRRSVDGVVYAASLAAAVFAVGTVACLPLGFGWTGVKYWLFFVGMALFAVGTFALRPRAAWKQDESETPDDELAESRFEWATRTALPDSLTVRRTERWTGGARLFLGSLVVLGLSMAMEFVFGVSG
jgi:energy-coupling factor transporter transmembrane protein EcfT